MKMLPGNDADNARLHRRTFGATAAAIILNSTVVKAGNARVLPSARTALGVIGLGSRGFNLLDDFLALPNCQIVAVCDVDEYHHRDRDWGSGPVYGRKPGAAQVNKAYGSGESATATGGVDVYSDYRELIARDDIDAVVVATPDHWHARCTIDALQAGKDVYCEKPVTHLFGEGQAVVAEVAKQKAVFQTGSQQRSDLRFHRVVELVRNGVLGEIQSVEVGLPPGYGEPQGSTEVMRPRAGLDYDFWCGPSEVLPLMQARHHRWWRGHRVYGGGVLMDWIGHHNDIAHWAIGQDRSGPRRVEVVDWRLPDTNVYNTPQHYTIRCEYTGGIVSTISNQNTLGVRITGADGWVYARRGKTEASDARWLASEFRAGGFTIPTSPGHAANFIECVQNRSECIAPADVAHRSITPGHLAYVSAARGRALAWDSVREEIVGDAEADAMLKSITYREPWQVPIVTDQTRGASP